MARKDVDLVIRAKDEAENVVKAITKALNDFNQAQSATEDRSGRTNSALGKLGAAFSSLKQAIGGESVGQKIAAEMAKADAAVQRLESATASTRAELDRFQKEVLAADTALARFTAKSEGAVKAQADQQRAVARTEKTLKQLRLETNLLEQASKGLASQQRDLPIAIGKQEAAIAKTTARLAGLSAEMAAAEKPTKTLTDRIDKANTRLAAETQKLGELKQALVTVQTNVASTAQSLAGLGQQTVTATNALANQQKVLGQIASNYAGLKVSTKAASLEQNSLAGSADKATNKLAREEGELLAGKAALVEFGKAAGLAEDELNLLTANGVIKLETALTRQRRSMLEAKRDFVNFSTAASKLAADIGKAGVPTLKMSQDFALLKANAAAAKAVLEAQREALLRMGQAFAKGDVSLIGLEQTEKQFAATLGQVSAAINKATADYARNEAAIRALHAEQRRSGGSGLPTGPRPPALPPAPPVRPWQQLSDAFNKLYGDSRKSLSLTQRLRGEVLSLVAAYGGFYGVVNILGQVLDAYQKLDAAQARLNVANGGDIVKSAEDMDFLRRTADRLGVDLGTLAQEYSKFSIATQGTNLAGDKTRKIFLSVAEAARVNRSSNAELSGVFVALTQIVSKGAVQMEELRQQLGDRLPGALSIMADGLGVTTGELIKMMAAGEVTSDALVPFAEELDRRFGPGLGAALAGTTASLGKLQNAAFQALVSFGKGGFIDSFTQLADKLTALLRSADFNAFLTRASGAFAVLIDTLSVLADNFQVFVAIVAGFVGLKLAPVLIGLANGMIALTTATKASLSTQLAIRAAMGGTAGAAGAAASGVGLLRGALTALLSSTGIGLAITAISIGIGYWAASADVASEALSQHKDIIDQVKNAYDEAGGSVDKWRTAIGKLTLTEVQNNLSQLKKGLDETKRSFDKLLAFGSTGFDMFAGLGGDAGVLTKDARALFDQYRSGSITVEKLRSEMDKLTVKYVGQGGEAERLAVEIDKVIGALLEQEGAVGKQEKVITAMTGSTRDAGMALAVLAGKTTSTSDVIRDDLDAAMKKLADTVDKMVESAPKAKSGIDDLAGGAFELQQNYEDALAAAQLLPDAISRAAAEQDALNLKVQGMQALFDANQALLDRGFTGSLVDRIIGVESGGNAAAANPNSTAVGAGQFIESTWLRMFKQYFPDRAAGLSDAMILAFRKDAAISRDMVGLYLRENATQLQKAGIAITDANLYLSHFLGPGGATALLSSAPGTTANAVLGAGQITANASILDGKTREEIIAWAQKKVGIGAEELSIQETLIENDRTRAEEVTKQADDAIKKAEEAQKATAQTLTDNDQAIRQQTLINDKQEKQAAIEQAIYEARKANPNITDADISTLSKQVALTYDLAHAEEAALEPAKAAKKAEEEVNNLLAQRNSLMDQFNIAKDNGDFELQAKLTEEMKGVNDQLVAAIDNAEAMWKAVGGSEADAAIAKLEATKLAAQEFSVEAKQNYLDWKSVTGLIVDGLASAFDGLAQKVADGQAKFSDLRDAFLQFASDFLIQIAQMILKQAIFNGLKAAFGGTSFGSLIGLAHTGGVVGSSRAGSGNGSRRVSPSMFAGAPRYHVGGIVGLRPGEVPMIAKVGEEVLSQTDPRNALNGGAAPAAGGGGAAGMVVRILNLIDAPSFLNAALSDGSSDRDILNWMRANSGAVKQAIA